MFVEPPGAEKREALLLEGSDAPGYVERLFTVTETLIGMAALAQLSTFLSSKQ
jgi:hypothetical protein